MEVCIYKVGMGNNNIICLVLGIKCFYKKLRIKILISRIIFLQQNEAESNLRTWTLSTNKESIHKSVHDKVFLTCAKHCISNFYHTHSEIQHSLKSNIKILRIVSKVLQYQVKNCIKLILQVLPTPNTKLLY